MAQCIGALMARSLCTIAGLLARQADQRLNAILQEEPMFSEQEGRVKAPVRITGEREDQVNERL